MSQLHSLLRARARRARHAAADFLSGSRLRIGVVGGLIFLFWALMFGMFLAGFRFLNVHLQAFSDLLIEYLFSFFFLALLVMMIISNTIIAYTTIFRSEETEFLFKLPLDPRSIFAYRSRGSITFSIWGMAALVMPMVLAYGLVFPVPLYFYAFSALLALLFVLLATEAGAFLALLVGWLLPRRKKAVLAVAGTVAGVFLLCRVLPFWHSHSGGLLNEGALKDIIDRIAFCRHWALPSRWVTRGMFLAAGQAPLRAGFFVLLLLANVVFFPLMSDRLAFYVYHRTWLSLRSASGNRRYGGGAVEWLLGALTVFLPRRLRQLVLKDARSFLRDPSQWSQFFLFFGLLALYIVNLPASGVGAMAPRWHSLVALLNLGATCLTLATLTSRFVYPQLSLEGRRIWITGLLPMSRTLIVWGKFLFAAMGTFAVCATLIIMSDLMISLPLWMLAVHVATLFCVCCGLNGLAVGLGALYPTMSSDNPAKIVSSFGGTLNLICSICFTAFALAPIVVPLHLYMLGRWTGRVFALRLAAGMGVTVVISMVACLAPMLAGARAFRRMEF